MVSPDVERGQAPALPGLDVSERRAMTPRARSFVLVGATATAAGLLLFGYKYLDHVVRGGRVSLVLPLVEELTGAYAAAVLLMLGVAPLARRRLALGVGTFAWHVAAAVVYSAAHTTLVWGARAAVFAALGQSYDYGAMPTRYAMELPMDLLVYALFVGGLAAVDQYRRTRDAEVHRARLEGRLWEAELRHLRGQLDPHFLFNALNAVSNAMYEDPASADEMIGHLSDLLRASVRSANAQEVPLAAELELLAHYVALLHARFGDAVQVDVDVTPEAAVTLVPPMVLQPLVENAVRHGNAARTGTARILVSARAIDDSVELVVTDDGPGVPPGIDPFSSGTGLRATRERLRLLYRDDEAVRVQTVAEGCRVTIRLPYRTSSTAAPALA